LVRQLVKKWDDKAQGSLNACRLDSNPDRNLSSIMLDNGWVQAKASRGAAIGGSRRSLNAYVLRWTYF